MNKTWIAAASAAVLSLGLAAGVAQAGKNGDHGPRHGKMFERFDTDKDGKISRDEHMAHAEKMFERLDADDDGFVTQEEAKEAREKMREMHRKHKEGEKPASAE